MATTREYICKKQYEFERYMTNARWDILGIYKDDGLEAICAFIDFCNGDSEYLEHEPKRYLCPDCGVELEYDGGWYTCGECGCETRYPEEDMCIEIEE